MSINEDNAYDFNNYNTTWNSQQSLAYWLLKNEIGSDPTGKEKGGKIKISDEPLKFKAAKKYYKTLNTNSNYSVYNKRRKYKKPKNFS